MASGTGAGCLQGHSVSHAASDVIVLSSVLALKLLLVCSFPSSSDADVARVLG